MERTRTYWRKRASGLNTLNARKGITTWKEFLPPLVRRQSLNTLNARKGITTVIAKDDIEFRHYPV